MIRMHIVPAEFGQEFVLGEDLVDDGAGGDLAGEMDEDD